MAPTLKKEFTQGSLLGKEYKFNPKMQGGVCFSLVVQWYKLLQNDSTPEKRMAALTKDLKLAGGRQMIYSSGMDVSKPQYVAAWAKALTDMGKHYGVKFEHVKNGDTSAQLAAYLTTDGNADKIYYLSIKFDKGGGHAIGMTTKNPHTSFDPNKGEWEYTKAEAGTYCSELWTFYASVLGGIKNWFLFQMESQQSVREIWARRV